MKIVRSSVELLAITPDPAQLIERCGRICYKSAKKEVTDETAAEFIKMLVARGHMSVLEHPSATFRIVCDRGITHQIVRHRLASYSQESTRWCNYGKRKFGGSISVIAPSGIREENPDGDWEAWRVGVEAAERAYFALLETGHRPRIARSVLPTCLKTEIAMTCNFREWCHFLALRLEGITGEPHPDIRYIAYLLWKILVAHCAPVFERFTEAAQSYAAGAV